MKYITKFIVMENISIENVALLKGEVFIITNDPSFGDNVYTYSMLRYIESLPYHFRTKILIQSHKQKKIIILETKEE